MLPRVLAGGVLNESSVGEVRVYARRTGLNYSESGLFVKQEESLENALWMAVRARERAGFIRRAAQDVRELLTSSQDNRAAEDAGSG